MATQDVMQVCMKGHVITDALKASPSRAKSHCPECGQKTTSACPACGKDIPGTMHFEGAVTGPLTTAPEYCDNCGEPFPWTAAQKPEVKEAAEVWSLIHPSIEKEARKRFEDGHRADAAEAAFKAVNLRVKKHVKRATGDELDGADLMHQAFSPGKPVIVLGDLSSRSGKDMQQGYMEIFAGAMMAIRNPKAHENIDIDETRAIHHLFLASLLMEKLDEAGVP